MAPTSPPTRPALRARYDDRQARLIDTAAKLFAERGYSSTSVGDLTEATGLAAGGIYHYIERKEQLLFLICDELMEPILGAAEEIVAAEGPADEKLRRVLRLWLAQVATHLDHMKVFAQERHLIERERTWHRIRDQRKRFERLLDDLLAQGEAEGTMSFADRNLTLLALLGMVNYTPQWMRPSGRLSADQIADGYYELVVGRPIS